MSGPVEDVKKELEERIESHRKSNPFQPDVTYEESVLGSGENAERIVNYYVDLAEEDRYEYAESFYYSDTSWVEERGKDFGMSAYLYCKWKTA